jgi:hypothetical protein
MDEMIRLFDVLSTILIPSIANSRLRQHRAVKALDAPGVGD